MDKDTTARISFARNNCFVDTGEAIRVSGTVLSKIKKEEMKVRKYLVILLALTMAISVMSGCSGSDDTTTVASEQTVAESDADDAQGESEDAAELTLEEKIAEAAQMSNEELYEKAKEESGTMMVYSTTSLCETALNNFLAEYPGLSAQYSSVGEADMFTKLTTEIGTSAEGADMVLLQNAYRMENELISEGKLLNYFPEMYADVVDAQYQNPTVMCFSPKLFLYNNTGGELDLNNVWQLTEEEYKGKIFFKDPSTEPVGMNFLVMLTGDEWAAKLADAYKEYYGEEWSADSGFTNAGYEFLDGFLANCNYTYAADGGIAEGVSTGAAGNVGLFVFSKLRSDSVTRENLNVAAYYANDGKGLTGFSGFMYPTYAQLCADTDMPYTSCLFINWILSEEGFSAWNNSSNMGVYSPNTSIALVPDDTGLDREITYWLDCLVIEDGAVVAEKYPEAYEFISLRLNQ